MTKDLERGLRGRGGGTASADGRLTTPWGAPAHLHAVCTSTSDLALDLLSAGAPHGTLVVADAQSEGRGRRGHAWHSPPGLSVYASLVLRPPAAGVVPTLVVAAVGLGLAEGIEAAAPVTVALKWPNDLWIAGRKVGGILVEARGIDASRPAFVAGFGVNVNHRQEDLPEEIRETATSLALRAGAALDRGAVLAALLDGLVPRLTQVFEGVGLADLHRAYRERSALLGQRVALLDGDEPLEGTVSDLSATDGLLLRTDDGGHRHVRAAHARDVRPV